MCTSISMQHLALQRLKHAYLENMQSHHISPHFLQMCHYVSCENFQCKGLIQKGFCQINQTSKGDLWWIFFLTYMIGTVVSLQPTDAQKPLGSEALPHGPW